MQRQYFYTSPVDHRCLDDWAALARALADDVRAECKSVSLKVADEPVFGYDTDTEEALAGIEERHVGPREVHLDLWCSIVHYGAVSVTLGPGVSRTERRALLRRLKKKSLKKETLLHEWEDAYNEDSGRVYGYALTGGDAAHRVIIAHQMELLNDPIYFGEYWLLLDEKERLDEAAFQLLRRVGPDLAIFLAQDESAAERVWAACEHGEGLVAVYGEDPAEKEILRRFSRYEDLSILLGERPSSGLRVTLGRCRPEDRLMVVYGPPWAPDIDEPLLFMI